MPDNKPKPSGAKAWWRRVDLSRSERKKRQSRWDLLLKDYTPRVERRGQPEDVKSNATFRNTEQKKSQLFFQVPDLRLTAKEPLKTPMVDPNTGQPFTDPNGQPMTAEGAVVLHEELLKSHMGPENVDLSLLMDRVLFDCLVPTGFMVTKIGYRPYIQEVEEPVMDPVIDPLTGAPVMGPDGQPMQQPALDEKGKPVTQTVPVVVKEEYFWRRASASKLLIPKEFKDTDFDMAPWLGLEFTMPLRDAKRAFKLPKDFEPVKGEEVRLLGENNLVSNSEDLMVEGVEIWYKAHLYRDDVVHPDIYWQLVLIKGHKDSKNGEMLAVVDRMSPYQEIQPDLRLTPDSMKGCPIHVGTIRDLSDSAYVDSDAAMTHTLVKEIDTYRSQTIKLRDANLTKFGYDVNRLTPDAIHALRTGDVGQFIPLQGGALDAGMDRVIAPFTKSTNNRTDAEGAFMLEQDLEKTLAIGANQAGSTSQTTRTATELNLIQQNTNVRMKKEQQRVLQYVLKGVRKYDSLLQRFADETDYVQVVGQDNIPRLQAWNRQLIAGRFAYDIRPDSQLDLDTATERSTWLEYYNLTAQDPFNNRKESLKKLQRLYGIDPAKALVEPPPPGPPPPNVSFRFAGEDLFNPMVREIIAQAGYQLSPESVQEAEAQAAAQAAQAEAQPQVDGTPDRIPPVSKRAEGFTGENAGSSVQ